MGQKLSTMKKEPYIFDEFFSSGLEESISPFLTKTSKKWGKNLALKNALLAGVFLCSSFVLFFFNIYFSHLLLAFVFFQVGIPALINTYEDFKNWEINIDVLMTLAAFISIAIGSGFEGALLLVLFELSSAMEKAVSHKAKGALHSLHRLAPKKTLVLEKEGTLIEKSVHEINVGTKILVKAGEIIPLDGVIIQGASSLNLVHLTGESVPVLKKEQMEVPAGAENLEAALTIEVKQGFSNSTLSKIIQLITEAQEAKPQAQKFLERFSKHYATTIICLTFGFAIFLPLLFSIPYLGSEGSIYRALTFMIAASPCALIIATPTAYLAALSSCAKNGILLKGGVTLDALAKCSSIFFDKTGTLTKGQLHISEFTPIQATIDTNLALSIAYGLERHIVHPISSAISKYAEEQNISFQTIHDFKSIPGYGLEGTVEIENQKVAVAIGLPSYIQKKWGQDLSIQNEKEELISYLLIGQNLFCFRLQDTLREQAKETIHLLKKSDLKTVMLTGDHTYNAKKISKLLDIDQFYANLRPEDKLELISKQKEHLAMVGDGINDAPALARASVGISMGKIGSDAAISVSDVVLLNDDIYLLGWLFQKAKKTLKIVKENLTLALTVIILATTPALLGWIPLWLAVVLHEGGTLLVGLSSLRLLKK